MKTSLKVSLSVVLAASLTFAGFAQSSASKPVTPLGLLRLQDPATTGATSSLASPRYIVDELASTATGNKLKKSGIDYLSISGGSEWRRPLRGSAAAVQYVSFLAYVSPGTSLRIGDVLLRAGDAAGSNFCPLMAGKTGTAGIEWKSLGLNLAIDTYGGQRLAALPVLTVRIDPTAGVWDICNASRPLAEDLPLVPGNSRDFVLQSGAAGAWVFGLVMSDDNPLYFDVNFNGVDDQFELQSRGSLLPVNAAAADRKALAVAWRDYTRSHSTPALLVQRILPDRLATP